MFIFSNFSFFLPVVLHTGCPRNVIIQARLATISNAYQASDSNSTQQLNVPHCMCMPNGAESVSSCYFFCSAQPIHHTICFCIWFFFYSYSHFAYTYKIQRICYTVHVLYICWLFLMCSLLVMLALYLIKLLTMILGKWIIFIGNIKNNTNKCYIVLLYIDTYKRSVHT